MIKLANNIFNKLKTLNYKNIIYNSSSQCWYTIAKSSYCTNSSMSNLKANRIVWIDLEVIYLLYFFLLISVFTIYTLFHYNKLAVKHRII